MLYDLKTYRHALRLTQQELAKILKISKSEISMIENGRRQLSAEAAALFTEQQKKAIVLFSGTPEKNELSQLAYDHSAASRDYLEAYCEDLQALWNKYKRQLKTLEQQYKSTAINLDLVQHLLAQLTTGGFKGTRISELKLEKTVLTDKMKTILKQKPEIIVLEMEGIKKKLASAKKCSANARIL